jgi:para-aminobenzoate synthetase/4-amino-4-deoxychorismate lyase
MPPEDRPQPGHGVYETLLVRDGAIQALELHLERLGASLRSLYGRDLPAELESIARARAAALTGDHRLRIDVVPHAATGADRLGVTYLTSPVDPGRRRAVALAPVTVAGGLGPHKWRDRRLLERARPGNGAVALLLDDDGAVLEAEWGNLWLVRDGRLVTPPADGRILPGVTRARLVAAGPGLGLTVAQEPLTLDDVRAAATVFVTSSLRLVVAAALGTAPEREDPLVERIHAALF